MSATNARADRCVLCGESNECGVAAGRSDCWCFSTRVPDQLLMSLPPEQRNTACICRRCIEAFVQQPASPATTPPIDVP